MERLTSNKPVKEMKMRELAHNACYVKDRKAMYRDYNMDVDARELVRQLLKNYVHVDAAFARDTDLDELMADFLCDDINSIDGLIAVFYRNLWAMAELRERLRAYEDTGLTPDQINEIKQKTQEET